MKVISLEKKYCEKTLKYLDAYIDSELLVETSQEVLRHLETCEACSEACQVRLRAKAGLRQAVNAEAVPVDLRARVQSAIREKSLTGRRLIPWTRWSLAAAAVWVVWMGGWGALYLLKLSRTSNEAPRVTPGLTLSEQSAFVLKIGIGGHIHCVIESHFDKHIMTPEEMTQEMGPEYIGLVPLLKEKLPERFVVTSGHRCHAKGREFVHMILKHENQSVSVIITEKQGVGFPVSQRVNSVIAEDVSLHPDRLESLEAVGFETKGHLAFVVSPLDHKENFQIASTVAPAVSGFLDKL